MSKIVENSFDFIFDVLIIFRLTLVMVFSFAVLFVYGFVVVYFGSGQQIVMSTRFDFRLSSIFFLSRPDYPLSFQQNTGHRVIQKYLLTLCLVAALTS